MSDPIPPDGPAPGEEVLGEALRRAESEARPRAEFRARLREGFVAGTLAPPEAPPLEPVRLPARWYAVPVAAALLIAGLAVGGMFSSRPPVADGGGSTPIALTPIEVATRDARARLRATPGLGARGHLPVVVEGRPVLAPGKVAEAETARLASLCALVAKAEKRLDDAFPKAAARSTLPGVMVLAASRAEFEAVVAPRLAPVPLEGTTVAFALADEGVLLLSPEVMDEGGPPCEEMDIVHESVHEWLQRHRVAGAPLPLWLEEGLAGVMSEAGRIDTRNWCGRLLSMVRTEGLEGLAPGEVLGFRAYPEMARVMAARAPCDERPFSLLAVFHAEAESLVLFLSDRGEGGREAAFLAWVEGLLAGQASDALATAQALGAATPEALLASRDAWLAR